MLGIVTALMLAGQPAVSRDDFRPGQTASIFSTIGGTEWCPAGHVQIDLITGTYSLTPVALRERCEDPDLERAVKKGQLGKANLATLRTAFLHASGDGLNRCPPGTRPEGIIVSNGGPAILLMVTGARSAAAPDDLSCWSEAAVLLSRTLETMFES